MNTNEQYVKTSANSREKNRKMLFLLVGVILTLTAVGVVYIIIYPNL